MARSERWTTPRQIKRRFKAADDPCRRAGVPVYAEYGKVWVDDSHSHVAVIGNTGYGKSQCAVLPFARDVLDKGESLILLNPKGEAWHQLACRVPKHYQKFVVDFSDPRRSPTCWSPATMPATLFASSAPSDHDRASEIISDMAKSLYPLDVHADSYWSETAGKYFKGLFYSLLETAPKEKINLDSIATMMEQAEKRCGASSVTKTLYEHLPENSMARRNLSAFVNAPNETRASLHSVAASGLEVLSRSRGLMEMLSNDNLNILGLDVERPFAVFVILPDETENYDPLAAMLVSQLTAHLTRTARKYPDQRLPIRVNIVLEELGSVGKALPDLHKLLTMGRSRNLRVMLVLQSTDQLEDVYGKSKAATINACIGLTVAFSTNNWDSLQQWSRRCGETSRETDGRLITEPLITSTQLSAMPAGKALILSGSHAKFTSRLPFYYQTDDRSTWSPPDMPPAPKAPLQTLDFEEHVKNLQRKRISAKIASAPNPVPVPSPVPPPRPFFEMPQRDIDQMIRDLDAKIAQLDAEEKAEQAKKQREKEKREKKGFKGFRVILFGDGGRMRVVAPVLAKVLDIPEAEAAAKLLDIPVELPICSTRKQAEDMLKQLGEAGASVVIRPVLNDDQ